MNENGADRSAMAVIFDCDGVLINSEEIITKYECEYLREQGLEFTPEQHAAEFAGVGFEERYKKLCHLFSEMCGKTYPAQLQKKFQDLHNIIVDDAIEPIEGIETVLAALMLDNVPMAVGSNSRADCLRQKIEHYQFSEFFGEHVYSYQDTGSQAPKPEPDLYLYVAEKLGYDPSDCIVIDDSPAGAKAGVDAEMYVIGYAGGAYSGPELERSLETAGVDFVAKDMQQVALCIQERMALQRAIKCPAPELRLSAIEPESVVALGPDLS